MIGVKDSVKIVSKLVVVMVVTGWVKKLPDGGPPGSIIVSRGYTGASSEQATQLMGQAHL